VTRHDSEAGYSQHLIAVEDPRAADAILSLRRADHFQHSARSFRAHLIGTWRVLAAWGMPKALCRAGLLHSAYSTSFYPNALYRVTQRPLVRRLIGHRAERFVYLFCAIDRQAFWAALASHGQPQRGFVVANRFDAKHPITLGAADVRDLIILESANLAEQSRAADGGPTPWMSHVFDLWKLLSRDDAPLEFRRRPRLTRTSDSLAVKMYRSAVRQTGVVAASSLDRAITLNPWAAEPRILRAIHARAYGNARRAAADISYATGLLSTWSVAWDKRLSLPVWRDVLLALSSPPRRMSPPLTLSLARALLDGRARVPSWFATR
jgi:hypothetical protein